MKTQEEYALEKVVKNLKDEVEKQHKLIGYYFTPHYGKEKR